ncbi:hypothetical protein BUALT_Bualt06G0115800 [Buddleja alternifolia]|uniref:Two-component response regulator n=1 Tax=Buddleja alternifolia TaxID=168488 RepID=A0AAV6XLE4_9LAMI|nr:hypothetical protein BUALT_Bualt06G0115800 [Buddleja alternifolia]
MSADDKEGNVLKGLENGAAFFIVKPVCPDDLRDLWQFAAMKKKSQVIIEETGSSPEEKTSTDKNNFDDQITVSASSVNEDSPKNTKDSKRKSPKKEGSDGKKGENSESPSQKKPKIIWTNSLHNRFLEAIRSIGLDRAVPKKILEVMNVPGLTRENVASHLQKYRIFLRRVSDASYNIQYSADKGLSKSLRSSYASSTKTPSTLVLNGFTKLNYQNPRYFPNQEPSSSNLITQSRFGQSRLLSNKGSLLKPNIGNTDLIHQNNSSYVGLAQNNYQAGASFQGHHSNITLEDLSTALSTSFNGSTRKNPGIGYGVSSHKNIEINANSNPNPSVPSNNFTLQTNYVGYEISNLKHLIGLRDGEKYEGCNSCSGTINLPSGELENNRVNAAALMGNENINLDRLAPNVGYSNSNSVTENNGGDQMADVIADYQMLLPSNLSMISGAENEGEIHGSGFSSIFNLPDMFEIMSNQQPLEEADFNTSFVDQVNIQNQGQRDDDDFLESLLAPFEDDETLEGI